MLELELVDTHYELDIVELDPGLSYNRQYFENNPVRYARFRLLEALLKHTPLESVFSSFPEVGVLVSTSANGWLQLHHRGGDDHPFLVSCGAYPQLGYFALTPRIVGTSTRPLVMPATPILN